MLDDRGLGGRRIARHDGIHESPVLPVGGKNVVLGDDHPELQPVDGIAQATQHVGEQIVLRSLGEQGVEAPVQLGEPAHVAGRCRRIELLLEADQGLGRRGQPGGRQAHGKGLKCPAHLKNIVDFMPRQLPHGDAAMRLEQQESIGSQTLERLADRGPGNAKLTSEFSFGKALAWNQVS